MADDDFKSARGSTFDDASAASGLPRSTPGIALRSPSTVGHWYEVIGPDGHRMVLRQTDVGPAQWTGRGIDINKPAAALAGYSERNFPTDAEWKYRHLGESLPSGVQAGLQGEAPAARAVAQAAPRASVAGLNITDVARMERGHGAFEGGKPTGMIIHHTSTPPSIKTAQDVVNSWGSSGIGSQFIIDRGPDGTGTNPQVWRVMPEGQTGWHIDSRPSEVAKYVRMGAPPGVTNATVEGVEIIADPTGEVGPKRPVTKEQQDLAGQLVGERSSKFGWDPLKRTWGHGEVNPGHREALEGMEVVSRLRAGTLDISGKTAIASGPPLGSRAYWEQGKVTGATQVAHQGPPGTTTQPGAGQTRAQETAQGGYGAYAPQKAPDQQVARRYEREPPPADTKPRSEPRPQVADAGPRPDTQAYWRGPKHGHGQEQDANEAVRVASARRSRGTAAGEPDAQSHLPYAGSAMPSGGDGAPDSSVASVAYEGSSGNVPERVVINITVARI